MSSQPEKFIINVYFMKTFSLLLLACSLGLGAYAQNSYRLTGELSAASRKQVKQLYITYTDDLGDTLRLDSAKVKRGKFTFEGTVPAGVEKVWLSGFPAGTLSFFLDPAELTVTDIDAQNPEKARVSGSHNNDVYNHVKDLDAQGKDKKAQALKAYEASLPADVKADANLLKSYLDAEANRLDGLARLDVLDFIADNLYEPIAVWLVNDYCRDFFSARAMQRDILCALPADRQTHPLYQEMLSFTYSEGLKSGADSPVIIGKDPEGKRLSSADLKGKYVILHFWASTDQASTDEVAYLKKALEAARTFGRVTVLSYSLDTDRHAWTEAIARLGMDAPEWHNVSALQGFKSQAAELYGVKKLPYNVLLNPQGKVISLELHGDDLVNKITRIAEGIETYE